MSGLVSPTRRRPAPRPVPPERRAAAPARPRPPATPPTRAGGRRMTPRRRRNRRALIVAGTVVVVVALVVGLVNVFSGGGNGGPKVVRTGSVKVGGSNELNIETTDAYHVVYRVDSYAGGDHVVTTNDLSARRPFESRLETRSGPPPGTASDVTVSAFGLFSTKGANSSQPLVTPTAPGLAGSDPRFDASLADMVKAKVLQAREHRKVLGRECQVFRTGEPIGTGRQLKPTSTDYADDCIDAKGIILEEVWFYKGKMVTRKVATSVDDHATFDSATFAPAGPPLPAGQATSQVIKVTDTSRPAATFFELDAPPAGYTHQGRYLVTATAQGTVPGQPGPINESMADVYVNGPQLLVVQQGTISGKESVFTTPANEKLNVPDLSNAELLLGIYGNVVRAKPDEVRYFTMTGTMPAAQMKELANHIKPQPKGTITPAPK